MKTLKEAKELAAFNKSKMSNKFPKIIFWIERQNSEFVVFNAISGNVPMNPLQKKRIFV